MYPVPSQKEQPLNKPLLSPNPVHTIYDLGLATYPNVHRTLNRTFSLLPEDCSNRYILSGNCYVSANDEEGSNQTTWFSVQANVPFSTTAENSNGDSYSWNFAKRLRESGQSPLFGVTHKLFISMMCTWDITDGEEPERIQERVQFQVPLHFARVAPISPPSSRSSSPSNSSSSCSSSPSSFEHPLPSLPYAQPLPAYSQLFESNGDRKIDYSVPLPLYTPRLPKEEECDSDDSSVEISLLH